MYTIIQIFSILCPSKSIYYTPGQRPSFSMLHAEKRVSLVHHTYVITRDSNPSGDSNKSFYRQREQGLYPVYPLTSVGVDYA